MRREKGPNDLIPRNLKDIEVENMLGKQVATDPRSVQKSDIRAIEPTAGSMGHVLTHTERRLASGQEDARICSKPDESRERISEAPVCKGGSAYGKSDDRAKPGGDLEFRPRAGSVRVDRPVLRAEARAVLVRLLVRLYVDRQNDVTKVAA